MWTNDSIGIRRPREFRRSAFVSGHRHCRDVRTQVQKERVETGSEAHRAEDAEADPPKAPEAVTLPFGVEERRRSKRVQSDRRGQKRQERLFLGEQPEVQGETFA